MIAISFKPMLYDSTRYDEDKVIQALWARYQQLPRYIAKKHLKAAMRRTLKPGVPVLRKNTPPLNTKRGRRKKGEKPKSSGALRRAVTTRAGQTGRNADGFIWGVLGYKAGPESRKAIWLEYGTKRGGPEFRMAGKTMDEYGQPAAKILAKEMSLALTKAVKELASGKNPGNPFGR